MTTEYIEHKQSTMDTFDRMDTFEQDDVQHRYGKREIQHDRSKFMANISNKMHTNHVNRPSISDPCRVCGFEKNTGRNFGVITCSTCKAFFRRNGRNASSLPPCRFGSQCPVNERTRRQCPSCRLIKCFAVGMQKDLIRTDEERAARLQLVKANRLQRHEKLLHQTIHQPSSCELDEPSSSIDKPHTIAALSSTDWIQLTNMRSAYEHFCLYPILRAEEEREEYLNSQPIKCRLKEHSFLHVLNVRLSAMSAFLRAIVPAFAIEMTGDDRRWLVRTNLHYLFLFSSMDLMNINGNRLHFDASKLCHAVYLHVYGQDLLTRATHLIEQLHQLIGTDPVIGKIMQIILFLSPCLVTTHLPELNSHQPSPETIRHVLHAQEQYTKILWSYLICRYGEDEARKLFVSLLGEVLRQQRFGADLDQSLLERQPFGNLIYTLLTSFSAD